MRVTQWVWVEEAIKHLKEIQELWSVSREESSLCRWMSVISKTPYWVNPTYSKHTICKTLASHHSQLWFVRTECLIKQTACQRTFSMHCSGVVDQMQDNMNFGSVCSDLDLNPDWTFVDPPNSTLWKSLSQLVFLRRNVSVPPVVACGCSLFWTWVTSPTNYVLFILLFCFCQIPFEVNRTAAKSYLSENIFPAQ